MSTNEQEFWKALKHLTTSIANLTNQIAEAEAKRIESDRKFKEQMDEAEAKRTESDRKFKEQIAEAEAKRIESDRKFKEQIAEAEAKRIESDRKFKEQMDKSVELQKQFANQLIKEMKEDTKKMKKDTEKMKKDTEKMKEDTRKLKKIVGGISNNNGYYAEAAFYNSLSRLMSVGDMQFDTIHRNLHCKSNGIEDEFDIVLTSSSSLIIVEVKYNFNPGDLPTVSKKIKNYRHLFPYFKNYQIIGGIAGLTMPDITIEEAKKYNYLVLTQEGNDLKILNHPEYDNFLAHSSSKASFRRKHV